MTRKFVIADSGLTIYQAKLLSLTAKNYYVKLFGQSKMHNMNGDFPAVLLFLLNSLVFSNISGSTKL